MLEGGVGVEVESGFGKARSFCLVAVLEDCRLLKAANNIICPLQTRGSHMYRFRFVGPGLFDIFSMGPVCQKMSKRVFGQETMLRCDATSSSQEPLFCPGGQSPRQIREQCELSQPLQYTLRQPLAPIHKKTQSQFRPYKYPLTR